MLDLRLYRAGLLPFLVVLGIAAFSVHPLRGPLTSAIPPAAFNGPRAITTLTTLQARFPVRSDGSRADRILEALIARRFANDGYSVERSGGTVIATQPGTGTGYLVLEANRAGAGSAALSGTAALLELGHDLASRPRQRPLALVSTDIDSLPPLPRPVEAAVVLGDLAGIITRSPLLIPFSNDGGQAPLALQQTLAAALPGTSTGPSLLDQLSQFAVPFSPTAQAPLLDAGIPAALVQQSGIPGPAAAEPVNESRLAAFGRAVAVAAGDLQQAAPLPASTRDLTLSGDRLGGWAVRALIGALLLAAALPALDVFARARRRKIAVARGVVWLLLWGAPVAGALLFTKLLGKLGALGSVPATPMVRDPGARGILMLAGVLAFFGLACILRAGLGRRAASDSTSKQAGGGAVAVTCLATLLAIAVWIANPYAAALLALPLYLWLPLLMADAEHAPHPWRSVAWILIALIPLAGVLAVDAASLGIGPLRFAWSWLLLLASGQLGLLGLLGLSLGGAIMIATAILTIGSGGRVTGEEVAVTIRGPLGYAGPGSLGGSASGRPSGR